MRRVLPTLLLAALALAPTRAQEPSVELPSLMTTPAYLLNGTHAVSQGTAFFYATAHADGTPQTVFLVTNYHVVTGHEPGTATHDGDRLLFYLHDDPGDPKLVHRAIVPLLTPSGDPLWVTSAEVPDADIALVPLPNSVFAGRRSQWAFSEQHVHGDIRVRPSSVVTLLGYPYGFYDSVNMLPVWKTGHIATEPDVDFMGKPEFLVDVSAFPGMSGAPVLAVSSGVYENLSGQMVTSTAAPLRLLGIFSAMRVVREHKPDPLGYAPDPREVTETPLQLGYAWKASLIVDMAKWYDARR